MRYRSGFTLVEVIITVVIISILTTVVAVAYTNIQKEARDTTRQGNVTVISEALEKYYTANGEYPSVRSLVNNYEENTGALVASKLKIKATDLLMPHMKADETNPLISDTSPHDDLVTYTANSEDNNSNCQTVLTGGCDEFTLKYETESDEIITISSRHNGRGNGAPTDPEDVAPPSISIALSGTDVVATATANACPAGYTKKFSFRNRVDNGAWTAYTTWATASTSSVAGTQGKTYDFQAVTRCDNGGSPGMSSDPSNIESYTYPLSAPAAPTTTVTLSGANVLATSATVTCGGGATAEYSIKSRTNDGTWGSYNAWSTTKTSSQTATPGVKYGYVTRARCHLNDLYSTATTGNEGTYTHPISAPSTPTISNSTSGDSTTWTWSSSACPAGTTKEYQTKSDVDWSGGAGAWVSVGTATDDSWFTYNQGYEYAKTVKARCYNEFISSAWSSNSATSSYLRPVSAPAAPSGFIPSMPADRKRVNWVWTAPSCTGANVYAEHIKTASWPPPNGNYGPWTTQGWYAASWAQTITVNGDPIAIPAGRQFQIKAKYICVNTDTGRSSAYGPEGQSAIYTAP